MSFSVIPASHPARSAHISLALAGLMWVLPFLYFYHSRPLTSFYSEWGAAVLGLCAMPLLMTQRFWQRAEIPRIVLLPIGLMLVVWVQFALGKMDYSEQALLFTLYMLWAALLTLLGWWLREELGLPMLATVLAAFLLLGAELSALVGVLQHYRWHTFLDAVVAVKSSPAIYGNLTQPNHFANYIMLGLISLGLLYTRWQLRAWQVALLTMPLLFVLTLSGSRSSWLYLLCMIGMSFLWRRRDKTYSQLLYYSLLLLLGFWLMHWVVQLPWLAGTADRVTSAQRLFGQIASASGSDSSTSGGSFSIRLHVWHKAWLIFTQFPLFGAGFGQFPWQYFQLGPVLRYTDTAGVLWEHAHNLVMQIAAEMGLAGLLILLGTLVLWFWQARNAQRSIYHWWGYGLLVVLGIHSMLEYPLWYAYFLGVAALTLGMLDTTVYHLALRGLAGRLLTAAILLLGLLSLAQMLYLYKFYNFEVAADAVVAAETADDSYAQRIRMQLTRDQLIELRGHALLLRPYVEYLLAEAGWDHAADNGALNKRVMHFSPNPAVVYREAWLLARAGQQVEAYMQIERAIWAYPGDFPVALEQLREMVFEDPAHFSDMLKFALQKHEEWQNTTHATY